MRRAAITYVQVGRLDLPADLAADLKLYLRDPLTGRTRYGELRALCTKLFSNWLDEQRAPSAGPQERPAPRPLPALD